MVLPQAWPSLQSVACPHRSSLRQGLSLTSKSQPHRALLDLSLEATLRALTAGMDSLSLMFRS